ncbi:hypothetical protein [Exiguobacterium sp. NG55]|uniref:hypothetical protein n=1 Tax=Exiguobacterium sp. NG55 TaxID=375477 RepID=UPI0004DF89DA|nr:hypothetical protein [Exiguobacterium sp. NG55]
MEKKDAFPNDTTANRTKEDFRYPNLLDKKTKKHSELIFQPTGLDKALEQMSGIGKMNRHLDHVLRPTGLDRMLDQQNTFNRKINSHFVKMFEPSGVSKWLKEPSPTDLSMVTTLITERGLLTTINDKNASEIINEIEFLNEENSENGSYENRDKIERSLSKISELLNLKTTDLLKWLETIKQQNAFLWVMFHLIISIIIVPVISEVAKDYILNKFEYSNESPKQNIKELKKEISIEFENYEHYFNSTRITNRETLVYRSSIKKSGVIDSVPSNRPVMVLMKKRNWSLIIYTNSEGIECTGWVFTGNLLR